MEPTLKFQMREEIVHAALNLTLSRQWIELHPEDPYGSDSRDLAEEQLDELLNKWAEKPWE
jgi:hypothetical protein